MDESKETAETATTTTVKENNDGEYLNENSNFYYVNYFKYANLIENKKFEVKIIELNDDDDDNEQMVNVDGNLQQQQKQQQQQNGTADAGDHGQWREIPINFSSSSGGYFVDEPIEESPFDFVFEPDHYKSLDSESEASKSRSHSPSSAKFKQHDQSSDQQAATASADATAPVNENGKRPINNENSAELTAARRRFPVDRAAKLKGETNGVLEYEYLSARYNKTPHIEINEQSSEVDYLNKAYYNEFDLKHHHLNAIVRGISLVKWPGIGFGFSITKSTHANYIYVNEIQIDSPAEFCLQVGDIIIEIDEKCPEIDFKSIDDINAHWQTTNFTHLMVIHESKYFNLDLVPKHHQASNNNSNSSSNSNKSSSFYDAHHNLLKDYCINCKDIVIVSWPKQSEHTNNDSVSSTSSTEPKH